MKTHKEEISKIERHSFVDRADVTQDYLDRMEKVYREREEFSYWFFNYNWQKNGTCIITPMPYNSCEALNNEISKRIEEIPEEESNENGYQKSLTSKR